MVALRRIAQEQYFLYLGTSDPIPVRTAPLKRLFKIKPEKSRKYTGRVHKNYLILYCIQYLFLYYIIV